MRGDSSLSSRSRMSSASCRSVFWRERARRRNRLFPVRLDQFPFPPHERPGQALRAVVRLPTVQPFRPEPPVVDAVNFAPAHPDDAPAAHAYVEAAPVRAEHAGRLRPSLRLLLRALVGARRPHVVQVGRALAPHVRDAVARLFHAGLMSSCLGKLPLLKPTGPALATRIFMGAPAPRVVNRATVPPAARGPPFLRAAVKPVPRPSCIIT